MIPDLKTCRICKRSNFDYGQTEDRSHWIKYGVRHSAHLCCLVKTRDAALIFRDLPTWKLEAMPFLEIVDLGLERLFHEELSRRENRRPPKLLRAAAAVNREES